MSRIRASGYSNVNDRFCTLRTERVTNQQMQKVQKLKTPSREVVAAEQIEAAAQIEGECRVAKQTMREFLAARAALDARTDRRRQVPGATTAAWKLARELAKLGIIPASKVKPPAKK